MQEAYSDYAAFFYNGYGGKEIAVLWKPSAFDAKEFKVNEVNACSFDEATQQVQCQKEVLIEDFKFILKHYFLRIDKPDVVLTASRLTESKQRYFDKPKKTKPNKKPKRILNSSLPKTNKKSKNRQKQKHSKPELDKLKTSNPKQTIKLQKALKQNNVLNSKKSKQTKLKNQQKA